MQKRKGILSRSKGGRGVKKQEPGLSGSLEMFGEKGERSVAAAVVM